jgi:hypothetical protein
MIVSVADIHETRLSWPSVTAQHENAALVESRDCDATAGLRQPGWPHHKRAAA